MGGNCVLKCEVEEVLENTSVQGFPIVNEANILMGYIGRTELRYVLGAFSLLPSIHSPFTHAPHYTTCRQSKESTRHTPRHPMLLRSRRTRARRDRVLRDRHGTGCRRRRRPLHGDVGDDGVVGRAQVVAVGESGMHRGRPARV